MSGSWSRVTALQQQLIETARAEAQNHKAVILAEFDKQYQELVASTNQKLEEFETLSKRVIEDAQVRQKALEDRKEAGLAAVDAQLASLGVQGLNVASSSTVAAVASALPPPPPLVTPPPPPPPSSSSTGKQQPSPLQRIMPSDPVLYIRSPELEKWLESILNLTPDVVRGERLDTLLQMAIAKGAILPTSIRERLSSKVVERNAAMLEQLCAPLANSEGSSEAFSLDMDPARQTHDPQHHPYPPHYRNGGTEPEDAFGYGNGITDHPTTAPVRARRGRGDIGPESNTPVHHHNGGSASSSSSSSSSRSRRHQIPHAGSGRAGSLRSASVAGSRRR